MATRDIVVLVGSLRKGSWNRKVAEALKGVAPPSLALEIVPIGDLTLYNFDLEEDPPAPWTAFRERVRRSHGVVFVTPEYNRSIPAPLKNAIDVGSRPPAKNVWAKKPTAIISASTGKLGGFGANHHLRQAIVSIGMLALPTPEMYVGGMDKLFDEKGTLADAPFRELLTKFATAYAAWVEKVGEP
jgi:chromate reductase